MFAKRENLCFTVVSDFYRGSGGDKEGDMNKMIITLSVFAAVIAAAAYWYEEAERARKAAAVYQGNNEVLLRRLKKNHAEKVEADKRLREMEKAAAATKNQGGFDWHMPLPVDGVTIRLRQD